MMSPFDSELDHHWLMKLLIANSTQINFLNQYWLIANCTFQEQTSSEIWKYFFGKYIWVVFFGKLDPGCWGLNVYNPEFPLLWFIGRFYCCAIWLPGCMHISIGLYYRYDNKNQLETLDSNWADLHRHRTVNQLHNFEPRLSHQNEFIAITFVEEFWLCCFVYHSFIMAFYF